MYTQDNIKQYLAIRNLMQEIRDSGEITKGPAPLTKKDASTICKFIKCFLQKYNKN